MEDAEMCEQPGNVAVSPTGEKPAASTSGRTPRSQNSTPAFSRQDKKVNEDNNGEKDGGSPPQVDINQNLRSPEKTTISKEKDEKPPQKKEKQQQQGEEELEDDGLTEEEYEVERILKRRCTEDGKVWLFVKWLGWDNRFNTWEALDRMDEVEQYGYFLKNFEEKRFLPPGSKGGNVKGFDRSFQVDSILGAKADDGKHLLLVKWKEVDFTEWVPAEDADSCCPRMVIDFYEKYIKWSNPSSEDQKLASNADTSKSAAEVEKTSPGKSTAMV